MTPSVVSLNDDGTNILVGEVARQRRVSHPGLTVAEFKRTMGTLKQYKLGTAQYTSEDLSAFLLKKLVADASEQLGEPVTEAVISIPAYFDDNQREATKLGGKDFDREIALDFCERNNIDFNSLDNMAQQNIIWAAENVKKLLSHESSANMHVNILPDKKNLLYIY